MNDTDPDRPIGGDPPVDAKSMLDVIGEHSARARAQLEAAQQMVIPYAIRSILDGVDPLEVAAVCGFMANVQHEDGPEIVLVDAVTGRIVGRPPMDAGREATLEQFANWLCSRLYEIVKGQTP